MAQIIRLLRSTINTIGLLTFGVPAITHLAGEQLKLYIGDKNNNSRLINTPPFQKQFTKAFATAVTIANGGTYNLISTLTIADVPLESEENMDNFVSKFTINSTLGSMVFPSLKYYCKYDIRVVLSGSFGGTAGGDRQFSLRMRRGDNALIGEKYLIKLDLNSLDALITDFTSFTSSRLSTDPFSNLNNGVKFEIFNNSGTTLTLNSFNLLIQGIPSNNEEL